MLPAPVVKRRRGRQPRPSLLSHPVKAAVAQFARRVGQPRVIEPAGFRDFRGWLAFIAGPAAVPAWAPLVHAVIHDTDASARAIDTIKPDLVREIVKCVVIPRDGESSKLVSTNCGRQCARPTNGVTLMTILDNVFDNLRQWKDIIPALLSNHSPPPHLYYHVPMPLTPHHRLAHPAQPRSGPLTIAPGPSRTPTSTLLNHVPTPPPESRPLPTSAPPHSAPPAHQRPHAHWTPPSYEPDERDNPQPSGPLPSFRELEDSLHTPAYSAKRQRR